MVTRINNLDWQSTGKVNNEQVAILDFVAANDVSYQISVIGTDDNGNRVIPHYAVVDNLQGADSVTFIYAPITYTVPPFTRRTFTLPLITNYCAFLMISGIASVMFCQDNMHIPDEQNQQASVSTGISLADGNRYAWAWSFGGGVPPIAGETIFMHTHAAPVTYQANFNGFVFFAQTNATADYDIDIQNELGATIGTLTIHLDGSWDIVTVGGLPVTMAVGSTIVGIGNATPDATLTNFDGTFVATQS